MAGVIVTWERGWHWRALVIGDSVVLITDVDGRPRKAIPFRHLSDFPTAPLMLGTRGNVLSNRRIRWSGSVKPGERIWLLTDELGRWAYAAMGQGRIPFEELDLAVGTAASFAAFIEELRGRDEVADDDMTVVRVHRQ